MKIHIVVTWFVKMYILVNTSISGEYTTSTFRVKVSQVWRISAYIEVGITGAMRSPI